MEETLMDSTPDVNVVLEWSPMADSTRVDMADVTIIATNGTFDVTDEPDGSFDVTDEPADDDDASFDASFDITDRDVDPVTPIVERYLEYITSLCNNVS